MLSIEKVRDELVAVDDELARWAEDRDESFFSRPDAAIIPGLPDAILILLTDDAGFSCVTTMCMSPFEMLRVERARFVLGA